MRPLAFAVGLLLVALAPGASADDPRDHLPTVNDVDIFLPELQACLWKGSYKPLVEVGPVTVWHYTCDDPDT